MAADASEWPLRAPRLATPAAAIEIGRIAARRRQASMSCARTSSSASARSSRTQRPACLRTASCSRASMAAGLRSLDDVADALPIVDKQHFLVPGTARGSVPGAPIRIASTSGTSGQPFHVPWSEHAFWIGGSTTCG